jgi:hypothetical protein
LIGAAGYSRVSLKFINQGFPWQSPARAPRETKSDQDQATEILGFRV